MAGEQTGIFYMNGRSTAPLREFPREFRGGFLRQLDTRFLLILGICAVVLGSITLILSLRPPKEISQKEILQIQERYAQLVLNQPIKEEEPAEEVETSTAETTVDDGPKEEKVEEKVDREKESFVEKQERKEANREERQRKRDQIKQQVRSTGLFAAITATGSGGGSSSGEATDLLGAAAEGVGDIGNINISKGTFATRKVDPNEMKVGPRGERTTGVSIAKEKVGTASGAQIASAASVNITTQPAEMKNESGGAVASKSCIQQVINRQSKRIKRVYENWLKRDPKLNGQLKVRFTILPSGETSAVSILHSTTGNSRFDDNILRYVQRWSFSTCGITESVEIVFPFAFSGSS